MEIVAEELNSKDKQPEASKIQTNVRLKTEETPLKGFIDTAIAREERSRYL